ncbi:hypothetical protein D3C85_1408350 [compost metagenome]
MVNMRVGVTLEMADDPVDELLEGDLFFLSGMCPEGFEGLLPSLVDVKTEEVFQATLFQRIALHIEEQVALDRLGHPIKATSLTRHGKQFE